MLFRLSTLIFTQQILNLLVTLSKQTHDISYFITLIKTAK